jgi:hypothetical protein
MGSRSPDDVLGSARLMMLACAGCWRLRIPPGPTPADSGRPRSPRSRTHGPQTASGCRRNPPRVCPGGARWSRWRASDSKLKLNMFILEISPLSKLEPISTPEFTDVQMGLFAHKLQQPLVNVVDIAAPGPPSVSRRQVLYQCIQTGSLSPCAR